MRNYSFVAWAPVENADKVHEQLRIAHAYQCGLVALERERRIEIDLIYQRALPAEWAAFSAAEAAEKAAFEACRRQRSNGGDMLPPDDDMKSERAEELRAAKGRLEAAREALKVARDAWYAGRKALTPTIKDQLRAVDKEAYAKAKRAYNLAGDVGLPWGTRLKIAESVERAAKMASKAGSLPHFPRFDGGGAIAVQLQHGLSRTAAMSGADTRFRLEIEEPRDEDYRVVKKDGRVVELPRPTPGSKRSQRRQVAVARLRIGSNGRAPVWAAWRIDFQNGYRPLPDNAPIKWVQMIARKVGSRTQWQLLLTVDDEPVPTRAHGPTLAVNFGWRNLLDGGLRVAFAVGSDGHREEVRVPAKYIEGIARVDSLRAIRDKRFEALKKDLEEWISDGAPEWLREATEWMSMWRSQKKLAFLISEWSRKRFDGDAKIFAALEQWLKKDKHLRFWECDEREKLIFGRKDFYRCVAARWAKTYARIVVAGMDLRDFAELPDPLDGAKGKDSVQRRSRFLAAPSVFFDAIKNACSTRGAAFEEVDGKYKTQTCNSCGIVFAFVARQSLEHQCECGAKWDQDENHCKNLLASGSAARKKAEVLAPSVGGEGGDSKEKKGRWGKRRSQQAE